MPINLIFNIRDAENSFSQNLRLTRTIMYQIRSTIENEVGHIFKMCIHAPLLEKKKTGNAITFT